MKGPHQELNDQLKKFNTVFLDREVIKGGDDWKQKIERNIESSTCILVLIGPEWLKILQKREAESEIDYVKQEIIWALEKKKKIIPIIFGGAHFPKEKELPREIRKLHSFSAYILDIENTEKCVLEILDATGFTSTVESSNYSTKLNYLIMKVMLNPCPHTGREITSIRKPKLVIGQALEQQAKSDPSFNDSYEDFELAMAKVYEKAKDDIDDIDIVQCEKYITRLARLSSKYLKTYFDLDCKTEVALVILIEQVRVEIDGWDEDDWEDDDWEDDEGVEASDTVPKINTSMVFDCDFLNKAELSAGKPNSWGPPKVEFAQVLIVRASDIDSKSSNSEFVVYNPETAEPHDSQLYESSTSYKSCKYSPRHLFIELGEDSITNMIYNNPPKLYELVMLSKATDGDLCAKEMCQKIFKQETQVSYDEFLEKFGELVNRSPYTGQLIVKDPRLNAKLNDLAND